MVFNREIKLDFLYKQRKIIYCLFVFPFSIIIPPKIHDWNLKSINLERPKFEQQQVAWERERGERDTQTDRKKNQVLLFSHHHRRRSRFSSLLTSNFSCLRAYGVNNIQTTLITQLSETRNQEINNSNLTKFSSYSSQIFFLIFLN